MTLATNQQVSPLRKIIGWGVLAWSIVVALQVYSIYHTNEEERICLQGDLSCSEKVNHQHPGIRNLLFANGEAKARFDEFAKRQVFERQQFTLRLLEEYRPKIDLDAPAGQAGVDSGDQIASKQ